MGRRCRQGGHLAFLDVVCAKAAKHPDRFAQQGSVRRLRTMRASAHYATRWPARSGHGLAAVALTLSLLCVVTVSVKRHGETTRSASPIPPAPSAGHVGRVRRGAGSFDEEDWLWLHTALAAYLAQVLIARHGARWTAVTDGRGTNYLLVAHGVDGAEHRVSSMDVVYDDLQNTPPVVTRMLATAELTLGVLPDVHG